MQSLLNYAGLGLGVLSIAATVFFAIRYAEKKEPKALVASDAKIALSLDAPPMLEVRYNGRPIPTLTSTFVWFWNAGRRPIKREDIASKTPIIVRIGPGERPGEILDVIVRKATRDSIGFSATPVGQGGVKLTFEFLDQGDGALIEIQHTNDPWVDVSIEGVVLGAPKGIQRVSVGPPSSAGLPFLLPSERDWGSINRSHIKARVVSVLTLALLWGFAWFVWSSRGDITTDMTLIGRALGPYVTAEQIPAAIHAVDATAKMKAVNSFLLYLMVGMTILTSILVLWGAMRRGPSLPPSLGLIRPVDESDRTRNTPPG